MNTNIKSLLLSAFLVLSLTGTSLAAAADKAAEKKANDPKNAKSLIYLDSKGEMAGTGDINKSGVASTFAKIGAGWHPTALAETGLPLDKYKLVDWVKIIKEGVIDPRYSLDPEDLPEDEFMFDAQILFETRSNFMDNVIFPHAIHTWWLNCEACHESVGGAIFEQMAGGNRVRMAPMIKGETCGRCHNKVAFPLADCKRCHNSPKTAKVSQDITRRPKDAEPKKK